MVSGTTRGTLVAMLTVPGIVTVVVVLTVVLTVAVTVTLHQRELVLCARLEFHHCAEASRACGH